MNVTELSYLTFINIDCSIWSARTKLQLEDFPGDVRQNLPPETLTTLGSKRLFDPAQLRIFHALKARAHTVCSKKSVRFLSGYATHEDRLADIAQELGSIAQEFETAKRNFIDTYTENAAAWVANFPGWENILLNALPEYHRLESKFSFTWQAFRIQPETQVAGVTGNNLDTALQRLGDTVIEELAKEFSAVYKECFAEKTTVHKKSFRPVKTLHEKVRALAFMHPHLGGFANLLQNIISYGEDTPTDPTRVAVVQGFLAACSTGQGLLTIRDGFTYPVGESDNTALWSVDVPEPISAGTLEPIKEITPPPGWIPPVVALLQSAEEALNRYQASNPPAVQSQDDILVTDSDGLW